MNKKYSIRQITVEDYTYINKWYKQIGIPQPKSSILPNNGLDGFVIEKNKRLLAAVYLYLTNSKMGYFDFLISDPNYKGKDRFEVIIMLFQHCTKIFEDLGLECVFMTTAEEGVIKRMKELGLREDATCEHEKRVIVYAYKNKNKAFS